MNDISEDIAIVLFIHFNFTISDSVNSLYTITAHIINEKYIYIKVLSLEPHIVGENPTAIREANPNNAINITKIPLFLSSKQKYSDTRKKIPMDANNTIGI